MVFSVSMANALISNFRELTPKQRNAFTACFLGWSLDAFDFFILTYCLSAVAADFHVGVKQVAEGLFLTLALRPLGALLFGMMAEKWGRRPTLMLNVISFSVFELGSAFAPTLTSFLVLRALFGIAMGGEWGVGAALAFESLPAKGRGFFSGLLQEGYVVGNLLAGVLYWTVFPHLNGTGMFVNWRVMFMIGTLPAALVFYIRAHVDESPAWKEGKAAAVAPKLKVDDILRYAGSFLFLVLLMWAFTSFSHGTQDLYPTFIEKGKGFSPADTGKIAVVANIGALLGGIFFGSVSEKIGRRKGIMISSLLAIPMIPLWAWSHTLVLLAIGGFLMQFMVQGAWGIVPAHLNELSPPLVRATFPGLAYQLGNLLSSRNSVFQTQLAQKYGGGSLQPILGWTVIVVALLVSVLAMLGKERRGEAMRGVETT